ncbi:GNAT family N-acetyltransferase [Winogradskyella flava]|uniref:MarR family transcriptional regulator/GNAT family N-acetyltransferase n=1 Tax=Winogradskyella flava TaxID=1884876 RepID=A0A842ISW0_9FLAO|nr:MarR family transcriptional regulator/GNAT family N-acetyltransferase [Winogradskyella flava]
MDSLRGYGYLGLGSRLKRVSDYMMRETQVVYDTYNIDFDPYLFPIFKTISNHEGITNTELVEQLKFSQPAITQFVNKLNKKGYIIQHSDKTDKRKKTILLTKQGEALLPKIKPIWDAIEKTIKQVTTYESDTLLDQLNQLEDSFNTTDFSQLILNNIDVSMKSVITIVNYKTEYKRDFYDLNIEWLKTFFYVESYDEEVLSKPNIYIIDKGGYIFFALKNDKVVGTIALMPTKEQGILELTKMAVSPNERGQKIGQQLLQYCIDFGKTQKLKALLLYSNTVLENAIYLYRKYGFKELQLEPDSPYERSDIKMLLEF